MKLARRDSVRLGVLFGIMAIFFGLLITRLVQLQLINGKRYAAHVLDQSTNRVRIPAERGVIFDRNGAVVAKSVIRTALIAHPQSEAELRQVGSYLDRLFGYQPGTAIDSHKLEANKFRYVKRSLSSEEISFVMANQQRGVALRREPQRQYPFGLVGNQVLGVTDLDNRGVSGFELAADSVLTGVPGTADLRRDGNQQVYQVNEQALIKPTPGRSHVLTIDWSLQEIIEDELRFAVDSLGISTGKAVFVDCATGELLAMAHYDRTDTLRHRPGRLRVLADQFEPGSSAKTFTAAALLDRQLVNNDEVFFCENGRWQLGRNKIGDAKPHGDMTFRELFAKSSNIGIGKAALRLGGDSLRESFGRFGFGVRANCGLPGERKGSVAVPHRWNEFTIASLSIGHAVAVNALQLAMAYAAIANGGELLAPTLVLGEVDDQGEFRRTAKREVVRRVFQPRVTAPLHELCRAVVTDGTGKKAQSDVIAIAGKTGTPQLIEENGRYSQNRYLGCFGGFFPAQHPRVAGVVVLEEFDRQTEAGATAAPAFRKIAERFTVARPDLFMAPERTLFASTYLRSSQVLMPDLIGKSTAHAAQLADTRGIRIRSTAIDEGTVFWQFPPAGQPIARGQEAVIALWENQDVRMFDVRGLPMQPVAAFLQSLGVEVIVNGHGMILNQSLQAGVPIGSDTVCRLECRSS